MLAYELQGKSGVSSMRSIGVGDYDVDEDHVRIERVSVNILPIVVEINIRCNVRFIIFSGCLL